MLANSITLDTTHVYDLVSRMGMASDRRENGVASNLGSMMSIKNTVDISKPKSLNRHLIRLQRNEIDATTGEVYPYSVHVVITRHKMCSDAGIQSACAQLADFISTTTSIADVLLGGN